MENQITCPHCKRIIANNPVIEDAAKRQGSDRQSITCECGERITYWEIAELLRNQNKIGARIQNWLRRPSKG
jgi:RNase P subunit RPR2